jgi:hypothetical protein
VRGIDLEVQSGEIFGFLGPNGDGNGRRHGGRLPGWGWHVPGIIEAAVVGLLGAVMPAVAIWQFSRAE